MRTRTLLIGERRGSRARNCRLQAVLDSQAAACYHLVLLARTLASPTEAVEFSSLSGGGIVALFGTIQVILDSLLLDRGRVFNHFLLAAHAS